jgi:hypothetical protein
MAPSLSKDPSLEQLMLFMNHPESAPSPLLSELTWLKIQWNRLEQRQGELRQQREQLQERIQTVVQQLWVC